MPGKEVIQPLQSEVSLKNISPVMSWVGDNAEKAHVYYEDKQTTFVDVLKEMVKADSHGLLDLDSESTAKSAHSILENVIESAQREKNPSRAARAALNGKIETTRVLLGASPSDHNKGVTLATAYFARAIETGAYGEKGINFLHRGSNANLILSGEKVGTRDVRDTEIQTAMDYLNAGIVLLAEAVANKVTSQR